MRIVLLTLAVFTISCFVDALYVAWMRANLNRDAVRAAVASLLIQVVGLSGLVLTVIDPILIIPNALGHAVGSYLGVKLANKLSRADDKER